MGVTGLETSFPVVYTDLVKTGVLGPFDHAEWHGWTPTDLIFPFFLFIIGVAMTFSFDKRLAKGERMLAKAETCCTNFCRFACGFLPRGWKRGDGAETASKPAPEAGAAAAT